MNGPPNATRQVKEGFLIMLWLPLCVMSVSSVAVLSAAWLVDRSVRMVRSAMSDEGEPSSRPATVA